MDELDRIRAFLDDAPEPDPARKSAARGELLAMARAEADQRTRSEQEEPSAGPAGQTAGVVTVLREVLTGRRRWQGLAAAAALLLVVAVGAVLVAPFEQPEQQPLVEPEAPPAVEQAPDEAPAERPFDLAQACDDPDGAYTVSYPEDWHANERCGSFAEEPVDGWDDAIGGLGVGAIDITVEDVAFEDAIAPSDDAEELDAESTTVDGRDAYRAHYESTGLGVLDEGVEYYAYHVDLGDRTLAAITLDPQDGTFAERRALLDQMMETISIAE